MPKVYAVRIGRIPGVYKTWKECEEQVKGYKGASFKSFSTHQEALAYVTPSCDKDLPSDQCIIYTDGSHQRASSYLGIGAHCCYQGIEYKMSSQCDNTMLTSYGITEDCCSNPTAEFLAVAEVLRILLNSKTQPFRSGLVITFMNDYVGPANWINGDWKAKEPYIQKISQACKSMIKELDVKVTFQYVESHSGDYGNDQADELAGDKTSYSNFTLLTERLQ